MEPSVNAAGAMPVLVCTAVLSVFWAIPQCLFVAELASMFDVNGGFVVVRDGGWLDLDACGLWVSHMDPPLVRPTHSRVCTVAAAVRVDHVLLTNKEVTGCLVWPLQQWVERGLGRYWAFVNGANSVFSSWLDNPVRWMTPMRCFCVWTLLLACCRNAVSQLY